MTKTWLRRFLFFLAMLAIVPTAIKIVVIQAVNILQALGSIFGIVTGPLLVVTAMALLAALLASTIK
jgi:hypothetical protein